MTASLPFWFPSTAVAQIPCTGSPRLVLENFAHYSLEIFPEQFSLQQHWESQHTSVDVFVSDVLKHNAAEAWLSQGYLCSIPSWLLKRRKDKDRQKDLKTERQTEEEGRNKEVIRKKPQALLKAVTKLLLFGTFPATTKDTTKTGTLAAVVLNSTTPHFSLILYACVAGNIIDC